MCEEWVNEACSQKAIWMCKSSRTELSKCSPFTILCLHNYLLWCLRKWICLVLKLYQPPPPKKKKKRFARNCCTYLLHCGGNNYYSFVLFFNHFFLLLFLRGFVIFLFPDQPSAVQIKTTNRCRSSLLWALRHLVSKCTHCLNLKAEVWQQNVRESYQTTHWHLEQNRKVFEKS